MLEDPPLQEEVQLERAGRAPVREHTAAEDALRSRESAVSQPQLPAHVQKLRAGGVGLGNGSWVPAGMPLSHS